MAQHPPVTTGPSPVTVAGFTNDGGLTVGASQDRAYAPELTLTSAAQASTSSATLTLDGSLDAAGPVTVTGTLVPLSGRLTVPKTLTVGPLGKLQDPAPGPEAGAPSPLELASGILVNGGTGTIGARDGINVLAAATLSNQGSLTADGTSVIDVADGAALSDASSLTTGALTIESGGGLSIDRGAVLIIGGNSGRVSPSVTADDGAPGTAAWSPERTTTTAGATLTCPKQARAGSND